MHRFRSFYWKIGFRRTYPVKYKSWVIVVPDSWVLMLTETFKLHLCSLHDPWREPGASNQLVRDNSCSHSSWSAPLEQINCSKTQNKPCRSPSPRALHIPSPMCPVASLIVGAALCAGPQYSTPKKQVAHLHRYYLAKMTLSLFLPCLHPWLLSTWWQKDFTGMASAQGSLAEMGQAWVRCTTR